MGLGVEQRTAGTKGERVSEVVFLFFVCCSKFEVVTKR
jgi:hypothetical protein